MPDDAFLRGSSRAVRSIVRRAERTVALLAFEDARSCPVADLMDVAQRQKTASELNAAILDSQCQARRAAALACAPPGQAWRCCFGSKIETWDPLSDGPRVSPLRAAAGTGVGDRRRGVRRGRAPPCRRPRPAPTGRACAASAPGQAQPRSAVGGIGVG